MRLSPAILSGSLLALLLSSHPASAELIAWTYNWSRSPAELLADAPGTGKITFTDEAPRNVVGNTDIVASNLRTYSTASISSPDKFTNAPYALSLVIVDALSGLGSTLTFTGVLNGTLTAGSSNIKNTFTGDSTRSIVLGEHLYTVNIGLYSPPGPPTSDSSGSISAHAVVTVESIGTIATLPEPSTLLLVFLALPPCAISYWRRCRQLEMTKNA